MRIPYSRHLVQERACRREVETRRDDASGAGRVYRPTQPVRLRATREQDACQPEADIHTVFSVCRAAASQALRAASARAATAASRRATPSTGPAEELVIDQRARRQGRRCFARPGFETRPGSSHGEHPGPRLPSRRANALGVARPRALRRRIEAPLQKPEQSA